MRTHIPRARVRAIVLMAFVCCFPDVGHSENYCEMYSLERLRAAEAEFGYSQSLPSYFRDFILPALSDEELGRLTDLYGSVMVTVLPPQSTGGSCAPFQFWAETGTGKIVLPLFSVKFASDCAATLAYLGATHCVPTALQYYMLLLGTANRAAFDYLYRPPTEALGIPPDARSNPKVDMGASVRFESIVAFVMCHELAHLLFQHKPYEQIPASQARRDEAQADSFALEIMARAGLSPLGAGEILIFYAFYSAPTVIDFESNEHWGEAATHPLTPNRLYMLANELSKNSRRFHRNQPMVDTLEDRAQLIASQLREMRNKYLQDGQLMKVELGIAKSWSLARLKLACGGESMKVLAYHALFREEGGPLVRGTLMLEMAGDIVNGLWQINGQMGVIEGRRDGAHILFDWAIGDYFGKGVLNVLSADMKELKGTYGVGLLREGLGTIVATKMQ